MAKTQVHGDRVEDGSIKNADIATDAAIEVSKLASVESTIIGRKTGGSVNVHLTGAEALAIIGLSKDWSRTDIDNLSILSIPDDSTAWHTTASYMMTASKWGWSGIYGYSDGNPRTIGLLTSIGATTTTTAGDWTAINGKHALITAKDGSWFNIKNNGTAGTDCRKIYTNQDMDVNCVTQALFIYDNNFDAWFLVSYTAKELDWRFTIAPIAVGYHPSPLIWTIPATGALPFDGFYSVDAFVQFQEYSSVWNALPLVKASTLIAQTLTVHNGILGSPPRELMDVSPIIDVSGVSTPPKMYNTSLQGSAIIKVLGDKLLTVRLVLPNCQFDANEILGGYVHVKYLGVTEG